MLRVDANVEIAAIGAPEEVELPARVSRVPARGSLPTNLGWALFGLPRTLRGRAFDVFHAPAYTAPLAGVRPLVVTIHDVSYARHPEWHPGQNGRARRAFYRLSATRADRIITDSMFSRDEIGRAYGVAPDRIDVIPLAASDVFSRSRDVARAPFVLHVGDLHPRRNLLTVLDVVGSLRRGEPGCRDLTLVLAGVDHGELARLQTRAVAMGAVDALRYVGRPDDAVLSELYGTAAVFAYPSRYEGFGLPVIEAMSCGCPVVASSLSAVPEVGGAAAVLLDPDDRPGWRRAIARLVTDPEAAAAASRASLSRAAEFSWDRTARLTLDAYRRVRTHRRQS